jgi:hypothetical protein
MLAAYLYAFYLGLRCCLNPFALISKKELELVVDDAMLAICCLPAIYFVDAGGWSGDVSGGRSSHSSSFIWGTIDLDTLPIRSLIDPRIILSYIIFFVSAGGTANALVLYARDSAEERHSAPCSFRES